MGLDSGKMLGQMDRAGNVAQRSLHLPSGALPGQKEGPQTMHEHGRDLLARNNRPQPGRRPVQENAGRQMEGDPFGPKLAALFDKADRVWEMLPPEEMERLVGKNFGGGAATAAKNGDVELASIEDRVTKAGATSSELASFYRDVIAAARRKSGEESRQRPAAGRRTESKGGRFALKLRTLQEQIARRERTPAFKQWQKLMGESSEPTRKPEGRVGRLAESLRRLSESGDRAASVVAGLKEHGLLAANAGLLARMLGERFGSIGESGVRGELFALSDELAKLSAEAAEGKLGQKAVEAALSKKLTGVALAMQEYEGMAAKAPQREAEEPDEATEASTQDQMDRFKYGQSVTVKGGKRGKVVDFGRSGVQVKYDDGKAEFVHPSELESDAEESRGGSARRPFAQAR